MGFINKLMAKYEVYRLEHRYMRSRDRRTTFLNEAVYIDGEYIYAGEYPPRPQRKNTGWSTPPTESTPTSPAGTNPTSTTHSHTNSYTNNYARSQAQSSAQSSPQLYSPSYSQGHPRHHNQVDAYTDTHDYTNTNSDFGISSTATNPVTTDAYHRLGGDDDDEYVPRNSPYGKSRGISKRMSAMHLTEAAALGPRPARAARHSFIGPPTTANIHTGWNEWSG